MGVRSWPTRRQDEDPSTLGSEASAMAALSLGARPVFVGQAPGPRGRPDKPLFPYPVGCAGHRLWKMTGLRRSDYMGLFDRINVLDYYPGPTFPATEARRVARSLDDVLVGRLVIFLGVAVARSFGFVPPSYMAWREHGRPGAESHEYVAAVLPHPSGLNRWYNDLVNAREARRFLTNLVKTEGVIP